MQIDPVAVAFRMICARSPTLDIALDLQQTTDERFDRGALRAGASVAIMLALPFAVLARIIADSKADGQGAGSASGWLFLISLAGFYIGAGIAAWRQHKGTPLLHAVVASVGAYVVAQAVIVVVNVIRDRPIRLFAILFTLTLISCVAVLGGLTGMAMQRKGLEPRS